MAPRDRVTGSCGVRGNAAHLPGELGAAEMSGLQRNDRANLPQRLPLGQASAQSLPGRALQ